MRVAYRQIWEQFDLFNLLEYSYYVIAPALSIVQRVWYGIITVVGRQITS
ncbi:MAG: hypothetical protein N3A59_09030 [Thermodesulfovibrionales bacterium]|nr:hypothetical protein [Thermodesulfovibrionales bacterium]